MALDFTKKTGQGVQKKQIAVDAKGLPKVEPKDSKHLLGKHTFPELTGEVHLDREIHMAKVETLLMKGVTKPGRIASLVGLDQHTADKYIEALHVRWASQGNFTRMKQLRGEARNRLDFITEMLWKIFSDAKPGSMVQVACMQSLQQVHDRRLVLENLTPKTLPMLSREADEESSSADALMQEHEEMMKLARALICHVQNSQNPEEPLDTAEATIEGDFTEVPRPDAAGE